MGVFGYGGDGQGYGVDVRRGDDSERERRPGYKRYGATLLLLTCSNAHAAQRNSRPAKMLRAKTHAAQRNSQPAKMLRAKTVPSNLCLNGSLVVAPDWNSVSCGEEFSSESFRSFRTVNAIDRTWPPSPHLPVFSNFTPHVVAPWRDDIITDFLGMAVEVPMYCNRAYMSQRVAHALRARQCVVAKRLQGLCGGGEGDRCRLQTSWPVVSEEYFEYADVMASVVDYHRQIAGSSSTPRPFTFVELGCGYGHWTFAAHKALEKISSAAGVPPSALRHKYLLVDVVPSLKHEIEKIAALNGVRTADREGGAELHFHPAYISSDDSSTGGGAGQLRDAHNMQKAYEGVWANTGASAEDKEVAGRTVSLGSLFDVYGLPECVDMVDIDVQAMLRET